MCSVCMQPTNRAGSNISSQMSDLLFILLLGCVTIVAYGFYLKCKAGSMSDDDVETDGLDTTKIRHERGM